MDQNCCCINEHITESNSHTQNFNEILFRSRKKNKNKQTKKTVSKLNTPKEKGLRNKKILLYCWQKYLAC